MKDKNINNVNVIPSSLHLALFTPVEVMTDKTEGCKAKFSIWSAVVLDIIVAYSLLVVTDIGLLSVHIYWKPQNDEIISYLVNILY